MANKHKLLLRERALARTARWLEQQRQRREADIAGRQPPMLGSVAYTVGKIRPERPDDLP